VGERKKFFATTIKEFLMSTPLNFDAPIEIRGYVTDPKRVGYQVLTNYESIYWRALIGNDTWSLYEVLRSFCHQGNPICTPSIHLLTAILGLEDKRALIGRSKVVKGKEYHYPGLIEKLQEHKLVIAEVQGDPPKTHYIFHVNLTPDQLTEDEIAQLPKLLQKKHTELLKRCVQELHELEAKRKPSRFGKSNENGGNSSDQGGGNFPSPVGISHGGGGKFPGFTPMNNTQYNSIQLTPRAREDHNNNSSDSSTKSDVVVAFSSPKFAETIAFQPHTITALLENSTSTTMLTDPIPESFSGIPTPLDSLTPDGTSRQPNAGVTLLALGLADTVTKRLTSRYSAERIQEKIEFLIYLQEHAPEKVKNPRGWLRRAIEENYGPPDGFLTQAERTQLAAAAEAEAKAAEAYVLAAQERQAEQEAQQVAFRRQLDAQYETTEEDLAFWEIAQTEIKFASISHPDLKTLLANAEILKCNDATVQIGIPQEAAFRQLSHPGTKKVVKRALTQAAGRAMEPEFVLLTNMQG
jgi:hypothetical protein